MSRGISPICAIILLLCMVRLVVSEDIGDVKDAESCKDTQGAFRSLSLVEIDIGEYLNGNDIQKKAIANTVDEQLHKVGSIRIKNHGIPATLINTILSDAKDFFDAPPETKVNYQSTGVLGANGWEPIGTANVAATYNTSAKADPVESIILWFIQRSDPTEMIKYVPPNLWQSIAEYHKKASEVLSILQNIFVLALDLEKNQFKLDMTDVNNTEIKHNHFNEFRLWNFWDLESNKFSKISDEYSSDYRFGAHSDFSCVTILRPGIIGLQIKLERIDNQWYTVSNENISEDSLVINLGEVFEMYTSGYWLAAKHRVARLSMKRRQSMSDFFGPNMDRMIDELKDCVKCKENRNDTIMQKYQLPIAYRTHARMRFAGSFTHNGLLPFWL